MWRCRSACTFSQSLYSLSGIYFPNKKFKVYLVSVAEKTKSQTRKSGFPMTRLITLSSNHVVRQSLQTIWSLIKKLDSWVYQISYVQIFYNISIQFCKDSRTQTIFMTCQQNYDKIPCVSINAMCISIRALIHAKQSKPSVSLVIVKQLTLCINGTF